MSENSAHFSLPEFTGALERCLEVIFHEPVRFEQMDESIPLPPILKTGYRFCSTRITGRLCLLMAAKGRVQVPADLAVHVSLVRSAVDALVIFAAPSLSAKQCLPLMAEGVPFVVPGHIPHIPELGVDLRTYGDIPVPQSTDHLSFKDQGWVFPHLPHSA